MAQRKRKRSDPEPVTLLGALWATTRFGMKVLFWTVFGFFAFIILMSKRPE